MQPNVSRSPSAVGLQTSGRELREMLEKSGARHRLEGAEKLDFLVWLADQVKGSVEERRRMKLKLAELTEFLARERVRPEGSGELDAKGAVSGLLSLRRRELARLSYDADRTAEFANGDACFELVLAGMPAQDVRNCFAGEVVIYDDAAASRADSGAGQAGALPGQIVSPRQHADNAFQQPVSSRPSPTVRGGTSAESGGYRQPGDRHDTAGSRPPPPLASGSPPSHFLPHGVPPPPSFRPPDEDKVQKTPAPTPTSSKSCAVM